MSIGYPPVQSQRSNDDERTVYLGPQSSQSNRQYAPQQAGTGYGPYGWENQAPPAQSGGGSKVAIIAIAVVVAIISVATLGFALTRSGKHDAQADATSQSAAQSSENPDQKSADKPAGMPAEPSAEPTPGPSAPTLAPSAIPGVLMSLPEAAAVLGVGGMKGADGFGDTIYAMSKSTIVDQDCISTLPAQMSHYQGSGYSDLRQQFLTGVDNNVRITQSVSTFTDSAAALRFVSATKAKWQKCAGRNINFRAADDPAAQDLFFVFGAVSQTDNVVNIPSTQEGHGDWTCQNGLTTRANAVIDLFVCGNGMQAATARAATDKISQKITAALPK